MLWLKFVLGGLIIAFCTLLGYLAAGKFRARKSFFSQMNTLNEKFLAELKFARKPVKEFLADCAFQGDFGDLVKDFEQSRAPEWKFSYLTGTEKELAAEYFSMLGKGDSHSQLGYFTAQAETLRKMSEDAMKEAREKGELYLKLGLLAGLAFVILVV